MKSFKRIIAVLLLTVIVFTVGYLLFTGSRLAEHIEEEPQSTEVSL